MRALRGAAGVLLALVPAAVRAYSEDLDQLLFPVVWILGGLLTAAGLYIFRRRWFGTLALWFAATTGLMLVYGIGWTGDWLRFAGFRAGLERLIEVPTASERGTRFYLWKGHGFAGLENFDYVAYDPSGEIGPLPFPRPVPGSGCTLAVNRPLLPPWRLVTTFNCALFGMVP